MNILLAETLTRALWHHVPAALSALAQHISTDLAVLVVVMLALVGALLAHLGDLSDHVLAVAGVTR